MKQQFFDDFILHFLNGIYPISLFHSNITTVMKLSSLEINARVFKFSREINCSKNKLRGIFRTLPNIC